MYELLFIVSPDAAASSREEIVSKVEDLIKADGGQIISGGLWGRRKFAYVIEKKTEGYYYLYYFNAPSTNLNAITDFMRLDKSVLGRMILSIADKHQKAIKIWPKDDKPKDKAEEEPATAEKVEPEIKAAESEEVVTSTEKPVEEKPAAEKPAKAEAPVESAEPAIEETALVEDAVADEVASADTAEEKPTKKADAPKKKAAPKVEEETATDDKAADTTEVPKDAGKSSADDAE